MTKKLRKRRVKRKAQSSPRLLAVKEVSQRPQPLPPSSKQAPVAKSSITTAEQADHYRYVLSDMRRSLVIGASLLVLLIALYFFLR